MLYNTPHTEALYKASVSYYAAKEKQQYTTAVEALKRWRYSRGFPHAKKHTRKTLQDLGSLSSCKIGKFVEIDSIKKMLKNIASP